MNGKKMRYNIASGLFRTTRVMTDSRAPDWREYQDGWENTHTRLTAPSDPTLTPLNFLTARPRVEAKAALVR